MDSSLRQFVVSRAQDRCEYCRLPQSAVYLLFHVEHIVARQHGGTDDPENLALACDRCNRFKGPNLSSIDPETRNIVRLFDPRRDVWDSHFEVRGADIRGLTDVGRASVTLLKMNTEHRMELRQQLIERGEF